MCHKPRLNFLIKFLLSSISKDNLCVKASLCVHSVKPISGAKSREQRRLASQNMDVYSRGVGQKAQWDLARPRLRVSNLCQSLPDT